MTYIVDRIESDTLVVEGPQRSIFTLPRSLAPREIREGDVIKITIDIDKSQTKVRSKESNDLLEGFFDE